ncbi:ABC transporter permease [Alphaproteobacteria bacterium]|nr:ABC transporter permease [Alphaproteobacteria bacterium]
MGLPPYTTLYQKIWYFTFRAFCGLVFFYLIAPIFVIIPLSFNAGEFFTYTPEMLSLQADGFSLRHYEKAMTDEWLNPLYNSFKVAVPATILSVMLGTLASIGLTQPNVPAKGLMMAIFVSPMIVPLVVSGYGMTLFYVPVANWFNASIGIDETTLRFLRVIFAHTVLGIPFVIVTVMATLSGFDRNLSKAAANLGAGPVKTFFSVQMPLILPGMVSGGLFAFITSFDEVVVVLFLGTAETQTLPWQMFNGLREQISLTILSVATVLVAFSIFILVTVELLRRRSERMRGVIDS